MTKPTRDEAIDQALRAAARGSAGSARSADCLDAETLAAWMEGGLDRSARDAAEGHASHCARCQAMLAAMLRAGDAQIREAATPARGRFWQMLPWLGPLTAAAATAVVWMAVRPAPDLPIATPVTIRPPAAREADAPREGEPAPPSPRGAREEAAPQRAPAAPGAAGRTDEAKERSVVASKDQVADVFRDERRSTAPSMPPPASPTGAQAVGVVPAPVLPAPPPPATPPPAAAGAAAAQPQAAAKASENARSARFAADQIAARQEALLAEVTIPTPDADVLWRLSGTAVQRSADRGATWTAQQTGASAVLLAGAAPSPTVCWVVGRAGTVVLTTDGRSWRRIPFPHAVDLVSVTARDARAATVRTADGRTFATEDGGGKWSEKR